MTDPRRLVGYNIRLLRKEHKLTQEKLSEKVGITPNHLGLIEAGKKFPTAELLMKIAAQFNVDTPILFSVDGYAANILQELQADFLKDLGEEARQLALQKLEELEEVLKKHHTKIHKPLS
jgi:transcriptional regulator with XRE-family HTH domain